VGNKLLYISPKKIILSIIYITMKNIKLISAIIITNNEEKRIADCLKSLEWVDEIVVVDSFSEDNTENICRQFNCNFLQRAFDSFDKQKNFALDKATGQWILSIDADERISKELAKEINETINQQTDISGFIIPRRNYLFGKRIKYTWGEDALLRLFLRQAGRFCSSIHEKVEVTGKIGYLKNPILHYNSKDIREYVEKNNLYTTLEAQRKFANGEKFNLIKALLSPVRIFLFRFFKLKGYKDGIAGFILSALLAFFSAEIHFKLWEIWNCKKEK